MSTPLQPIPQSSSPAYQSTNNDVYSRMVNSAVAGLIEDVILIDEATPGEAAEVCDCGKCGKNEFELVGYSGGLAGAPQFYIETRVNSDPLVLDELTISADLENLTPARNVTTELPFQPVSVSSLDDETFNEMDTIAQMIFAAVPSASAVAKPEDYSTSFNPSNFDPFDPHIDPDADLSIAS